VINVIITSLKNYDKKQKKVIVGLDAIKTTDDSVTTSHLM